MEVPKELKRELPYDPEIPFLGTYPEKIIIQKDMNMQRLCIRKAMNIHPNVRSSTIYNSHYMEAT